MTTPRCTWQFVSSGGGKTETCDQPADDGSVFCATHRLYGWKAAHA